MNSNYTILCCTSLKDYVEHVQKKLNTDYPVVYLSRIYHRDPAEMRAKILEALEQMGEDREPVSVEEVCESAADEIDASAAFQPASVLVAMGYCGGSWEDVTVPCRLVIPKVDDCITLLLNREEERGFDLKKPDHLYVKDKDPGKESFRRIFEHMAEGLDAETRDKYHEDWKRYYRETDIIETEVNGARRPEYVEAVKADADWLSADMDIITGSTYLLEKMISGNWDDDFLVVEPGGRTTVKDMK